MSPCPRCQSPLTVEEHGDIVLERCEHCGGYWLKPDDFKTIIHLIRLPVSGRVVRAGIDLTDVNEDAACPHCGVAMQPFNYAGDSGVILDRCPICRGLWLDNGDFERVLAVVSASEQDLERDIKRISADLHEVEVRQDALEQQDGSPITDPLASVGQDMVGIDAGAAVLALDNYLFDDRVRRVFHALPSVSRGLQRLGFTCIEKVPPPPTVADDP